MIYDRKSRREVGAWLSALMPKQCTLAEAAKVIGVSRSRIQHIERDALWKVFMRMMR